MGKRSRKRASGTDAPARPAPRTTTPATRPASTSSAPHAKPLRRKATRDEAPPAPWAPFPLVELCILAGLILLLVGFFGGGDQRLTLFVVGFALIAISAVDQAIREHFAGFRSHTTLLAASSVLFPVLPLTVLVPSIPRIALVAAGALGFAVAFFALRSAFARRAGGMAFRA